MNLTLFAAAYCLFHAVHGIADFWFQTSWQANNKTSNKKALWAHTITYTLAFIPALLLLSSQGGNYSIAEYFTLLVVIALPHAWMDTRKFLYDYLSAARGWMKDGRVHQKLEWLQQGKLKELGRGWKGPGLPAGVFTSYDSLVKSGYNGEYAWVDEKGRANFFIKDHYGTWKELPEYREPTGYEAAVRVLITIEMDQTFHMICLCGAALLASIL